MPPPPASSPSPADPTPAPVARSVRRGRRGVVPVVAWLAATGAAVTLSWWGVHTVMIGTAHDPPRALPVTATSAPASPVPSATHRPRVSHPAATPSPSTSAAPTRSAAPRATPRATSRAGAVKGYATAGGRAVFDLGGSSASLVSATPTAGWSVRVWKESTWIRVEFASGTRRVSVFCTWHDHAPAVEVATY